MGANQHTSKGRRSGYRIMFTADEKRALDARADAEGVTIAELIRRALGLAEAPSVDAPTCRATWCRYYGQRHATPHKGGE